MKLILTSILFLFVSFLNAQIITEKKGFKGKIYEQPDIPAEFKGGERKMRNWIERHFEYPEYEAKNLTDGEVTIKFIVEIDGSLTAIKISKSATKNLDEACLYVVRKMPNWVPARVAGKRVRSTYFLTINCYALSRG